MFIGLLKRVLLAAVVLFLMWWLIWGLTDRQIDAFQKYRASWVGTAREAKEGVMDLQKTAEHRLDKIKK